MKQVLNAFENAGYKAKKMNQGTYSLRKEVMQYIYELKQIVNLPRVTIRIVDCQEKGVLGAAYLGHNVVVITDAGFKSPDLRQTVYHEVLHAVYSQNHVKGCPLMAAHQSGKQHSKEELQKLFLKYAK